MPGIFINMITKKYVCSLGSSSNNPANYKKPQSLIGKILPKVVF